MILSVSQRTDIPALYVDWFLNRLRAGFLYVKNPYSDQVINIKLEPEIIDCIIFFTKNPIPILDKLDEIDQMGYHYYFHVTITPYKEDIETNMIDKREVLDSCIYLAKRLSKKHLVVRYDPVFLTEKYTVEYHKKAFEKLCFELKDSTTKIVINFLDIYPKMQRNIKRLNIIDPDLETRRELIDHFLKVTKQYNMELEVCMKHNLVTGLDVKMAKCIDGELIEEITGRIIDNIDVTTKSRACNCMPYVDIGTYDTCTLKCRYCYANNHARSTDINIATHDKTSPILVGEYDEDNIINHKRNHSNQTTSRQLKFEL